MNGSDYSLHACSEQVTIGKSDNYLTQKKKRRENVFVGKRRRKKGIWVKRPNYPRIFFRILVIHSYLSTLTHHINFVQVELNIRPNYLRSYVGQNSFLRWMRLVPLWELIMPNLVKGSARAHHHSTLDVSTQFCPTTLASRISEQKFMCRMASRVHCLCRGIIEQWQLIHLYAITNFFYYNRTPWSRTFRGSAREQNHGVSATSMDAWKWSLNMWIRTNANGTRYYGHYIA